MHTTRTFVAIVLLIAAMPLRAAQTATNTRGFVAEGVYDYNGIDSVNLFNGGLTVRIPLGTKYTSGDRLSYSFSLTYNSAIWDFEERYQNVNNSLVRRTESIPNVRSQNAGLGWLLTLGELYYHQDSFMYVGPDGEESTFRGSTPQSSATPFDPNANVLFSLDSRYLRMRKGTAGAIRYVDFPDGVTKEFTCLSTAAICEFPSNDVAKYALTKISDAFGNEITIDRGTEPAHTTGTLWTWNIREKSEAGHSVEHHLILKYIMPAGFNAPFGWVVKQLDLEVSPSSFTANQPVTEHRLASYIFNYDDNGRLTRHPFHTAGGNAVHIQPKETTGDALMHVPLLTSIALPDGTQWQFQYKQGGPAWAGTSADYPQSDDDKLLERMIYPTGGKVHYEWQLYAFPRRTCYYPTNPPGCTEPCSDDDQVPADTMKSGVSLRQYETPSGAALTPTRYIITYVDSPGPDPNNLVCFGAHTMRNTVVDPLGNASINYFSLIVDPNSTIPNAQPLNFGLPSAVTKPDPLDSTRSMSTEVFQCPSPDLFDPAGQGNNDATIKARAADPQSAGCTPKRQTYVRFEVTGSTDCDHTTFDLPGCYAANRRLLSQRTVFNDDGNSWTSTENANFDGLGHFREVNTKSNFGALNATADTAGTGTGSLTGPRGDWQLATTNWNPSTRFPTLGYPAPTEPWIINTYDAKSVEAKTTAAGEPAAAGGIAKSQYFFDAAGFLTQKRILVGGAPGDKDLLTTFKRVEVGDGRVRVEERYYGGDCIDGDCPNLDTSELPIANPGSADYVIFRTYRFGSVERVEYKECSGNLSILRTEFNEIDPATGMLLSTRDTADATTTFLYDKSNRLLEAHPPGDAATTYTYNNANGTVAANVVATVADGTQKQPQTKWEYDPWGRLASILRRTPAGWNRTTTHYYPNGWIMDQSTAGEDGKTNAGLTKFTKYDPFGRLLAKTHPDTDSHTTSYVYQGTRVTKETITGVALSSTDNGTTSTTRLHDGLGHLVAVAESSAGLKQTAYEYDSSGRLVKVKAGTPTQSDYQERTFQYDNRGFMTNERHPEFGSSPGITYKYFDARGHVHQIDHQTSGHSDLDVTLIYDAAERPTVVKQTKNNRILKTWGYFQNGDTGKVGLLRKTERHNWIHNPASASSPLIDYTISETYDYWDTTHRLKSTMLSLAAIARWRTSFFYDNLGNLSGTQYPKLTSGCVPSTNCLEIGTDRFVSNNFEYGFLTSVPGFVTSIGYNFNELPKDVKHANNVTWTATVSDRNLPRPASLKVANAAGQSLWQSNDYKYDANGSIFAIGSYAFVYDSAGRLTSASIGGDNQTFSYDRHGNHTERSDVLPDPTTNRLPTSVAGYDLGGNLTSFTDPREGNYHYAYEYDPFSMMHMTAMKPGNKLLGRIFLYNINDERVASIDYQGATIKETWSARGADNRVIRDFQRVWDPTAPLPGKRDPAQRGWSFVRDYVFRGSALAASVASDGTVTHIDVDHLDTPRAMTNASGNLVSQRTYRAFGDEINPASDPVRLKFTGHEHDDAGKDGQIEIAYGDVDYMHARYYNPKLGRFLSVDPGRDVDSSHPQSWNLFAYVRNSPIGTADPTGRAGEGTGQPEFRDTDMNQDREMNKARGEKQRLTTEQFYSDSISAERARKDCAKEVYEQFFAPKSLEIENELLYNNREGLAVVGAGSAIEAGRAALAGKSALAGASEAGGWGLLALVVGKVTIGAWDQHKLNVEYERTLANECNYSLGNTGKMLLSLGIGWKMEDYRSLGDKVRYSPTHVNAVTPETYFDH